MRADELAERLGPELRQLAEVTVDVALVPCALIRQCLERLSFWRRNLEARRTDPHLAMQGVLRTTWMHGLGLANVHDVDLVHARRDGKALDFVALVDGVKLSHLFG